MKKQLITFLAFAGITLILGIIGGADFIYNEKSLWAIVFSTTVTLVLILMLAYSIFDEFVSELEIRKTERKIVCLCGSTKFKDEYISANRTESLKGNIVLTVAMFGHIEDLDMEGEDKKVFDKLHMEKIKLCDEVLVLNVGGYIGESTENEISYAQNIGKTIGYLEPLSQDN